jgi:uncharacterized protein YgiB involved in biofilm formation
MYGERAVMPQSYQQTESNFMQHHNTSVVQYMPAQAPAQQSKSDSSLFALLTGYMAGRMM